MAVKHTSISSGTKRGEPMIQIGDIVASSFDYRGVSYGDFGLVKAHRSHNQNLLTVEFSGNTRLTVDSTQVVNKHLREGKFVCSAIYCDAGGKSSYSHASLSSKAILTPGQIGCIVGCSNDPTAKDRIVVNFGSNNQINMLEDQIQQAPTLFTHIGATVYSLIDHDRYFKKGDRGVLVGPSSDSKAHDRVAVRFDNNSSAVPGLSGHAFNLSAEMISEENPFIKSNVGRQSFSQDRLQQNCSKILDRLEQLKKASQASAEQKSRLAELSSQEKMAAEQQKIASKQLAEITKLANLRQSYLSGRSRNSIQELTSGFEQCSLRTDSISLISHTHGRERRAERKILRRELQAAIKYGNKERANPGRNGEPRWRYTYDGVVYITDDTSRHEITSWRIDGEDEDSSNNSYGAVAPAEINLEGRGCHAVLIVDNSGSMRTNDVKGYKSRAHAVYECLIRDFVKEQVKSGEGKDVVITLISMSDSASILIDKQPLDSNLIAKIEKIQRSRQPRSHGNYIPALDKALEVMTEDAKNRGSLVLLLFSDGAPSDQVLMECEHGVPIFQIDRQEDPLMRHRSRGLAWSCRKRLQESVKKQCLDRVRRIGQIFGKDKVILRTVAFGPQKEDFQLLEELAKTLPRGEFQKLGLNASNLKTAFSSLSSSMTQLRTEGGGSLLTPRRDKVVDKQHKVDMSGEVLHASDGWWIYSFEDFIGKFVYDNNNISSTSGSSTQHQKLKEASLTHNATGLAFYSQPFAEGAERFVYRSTEIEIPKYQREDWYYICRYKKSLKKGLRLVAKEAKDEENLERGRKFHETFARIQNDAAGLALAFNKTLPQHRPSEWNVSFLKTFIYGCIEPNHQYKDDRAWVLVEEELEGRFTKWNNNAGAVKSWSACKNKASAGGALGIGTMALLEEDEEEDEDEEDSAPIQTEDVPQAFSHFTYEHSKGKKLVCDLQGIWNPDDGFVLTDPVVHYVSSRGKKHKNGATDKGLEGVKRFFGTHECNALCTKIGLKPRSSDDLIFEPSSK